MVTFGGAYAVLPYVAQAAVEASFDGGTLTTKPFRFVGSHLYVNCNTEFGELEIEVLDNDEKTYPDFKSFIRGVDEIKTLVQFSDRNLSSLVNRSIRLRFTIRNAQLFSFAIQ
jgi:hypothetical protein